MLLDDNGPITQTFEDKRSTLPHALSPSKLRFGRGGGGDL